MNKEAGSRTTRGADASGRLCHGLVILSVVSLASAVRPAHAEGSPFPSPPAAGGGAAAASTVYSAQIVLADLGALGLGLAVAEVARTPWPGAVSWSLASPIVHVVHHHPARAALSLLLHVGLPTVGAVAGARIWACAGSSSYESCYLGGLWAGGLLGAVAATTFDAVVLARLPEA